MERLATTASFQEYQVFMKKHIQNGGAEIIEKLENMGSCFCWVTADDGITIEDFIIHPLPADLSQEEWYEIELCRELIILQLYIHRWLNTPKVLDYEAITRKENYESYLRTDWWKLVSWANKWAAGFKCSLCDSTERLNTHHKNYDNKGMERFEDLICLCSDCHAKYHGKFK